MAQGSKNEYSQSYTSNTKTLKSIKDVEDLF